MSAIPSGAVPVTFAADRSLIDNYLAELRRGVVVPINFSANASGVNPQNSSSSSISPQPFTQQFTSSGISPFQFAPNAQRPSLQGSSSVGQQSARDSASLQQSATALQDAAEALQSAAEALQSPSTGSSSGGSGRGTGRGRSQWGRLSRVAAGYGAYLGVQALSDLRESNIESSLAGNNLEAQYQSQQKLIERVSAIPILGRLINLAVDPLGTRQLAALFPRQQAELGERLAASEYASGSTRLSLRSEAEVAAASPGYDRQRLSAQAEYDRSVRDSQERQRGVGAAQQDVFNSRRAEIQSDYDNTQKAVFFAHLVSPFVPSSILDSAKARYDTRIASLQSEQAQFGRRSAADVAADTEQARIKFEAEKRDIENRITREGAGIRASNESLDILINGPGTIGTRQYQSQTDTILRRTQLQELDAFQEGKGRLVPDIAKGGALELQALQQNFLNGIQGEQVDINRTAFTGDNTESAPDILKSIQDAILKLADTPQTLQDILKALGGLVAGP